MALQTNAVYHLHLTPQDLQSLRQLRLLLHSATEERDGYPKHQQQMDAKTPREIKKIAISHQYTGLQ